MSLNTKLNGVNGIGMKNQLKIEHIHPKLAGRHIMHVNILAKCSLTSYANSLIRENIWNGPSLNAITLHAPYAITT
jgi:hypothetical protein